MVWDSADAYLCDLGAIEYILDSQIAPVGQDIKYGQVAKFSILSSLSEADLVTPTTCKKAADT
ncbi:hypothetical protein [Acinetobacter baumannii]|uniref:hypothetical protein n=1 Tax=Acinetobacter baumannii TaxID=470 RepID=UPI001C06AAAB|nr:hypothetical protein [Acinetobacter baumannii]